MYKLNANEFISNFKKMKDELKQSKNESENSNELSYLILSTDWVRIYLSGNFNNKEVIIQVDVSPNSDTIKNIANSDFSRTDEEKMLRKILDNHILYLNYLTKLLDQGFSIGFIREEGIWYGTKILVTEPNEDSFNLINPPKSKE